MLEYYLNNVVFLFFLTTFGFKYIYILFLGIIGLKRLFTYLHILQQDDYNSKRFLYWFFKNKAYDRYMTSVIFICITINWICGVDPDHFILKSIALIVVTYFSFKEKLPFLEAKKKLVLTPRATRILITSYVLFIPMIVVSDYKLLSLILIIQSIPFVLAIGNLLTLPMEYFIQKKYLKLAKNKLKTLNPVIIGITGSYGKTSVKHILGHILNKYKPTLFTPGSVNTPMGICSIIQNRLQATHKFFIVEMGAYKMGSITKICKLTPPNIGMVTSIGPCHLERFGSMENIAYGKSELLNAVSENTYPIGYSFPEQLVRLNAFKDYFSSKLMIKPLECLKKEQNIEGLYLEIRENNTVTQIQCPIYGLHQADNIVLAITLARKLGAPMELIKGALKSLKQVSARLEVNHDQENVTWINDGFNTNPEGFKQAINLLEQFGNHKKGRKILVTPGVIELGDQHDEVHAQLAKYAMSKIDIVIIVAYKRITSFVTTCELLKKGDQMVLKAQDFKEANTWLDTYMTNKDTILIANDLPDILETRPDI